MASFNSSSFSPSSCSSSSPSAPSTPSSLSFSSSPFSSSPSSVSSSRSSSSSSSVSSSPSSSSSSSSSSASDADLSSVLIVCARAYEAFAVRDVFRQQSGNDWTKPAMRENFTVQTIKIKDGNGRNDILVYLSFPPDQGGDFALDHIRNCLSSITPDLCIMTGICAGKRGTVSLGDLIVANWAYNYERGKQTDCGSNSAPILYGPDNNDKAFLTWVQATMFLNQQWKSHTIVEPPKRKLPAEGFLKRALYEYQGGAEHSDWLWEHGFDRSKSIVENRDRIPGYDQSVKSLIESKVILRDNSQLKLSEETVTEIQMALMTYGYYPERSDEPVETKLHFGIYGSGSSVRADTVRSSTDLWNSEEIKVEERQSKVFYECQQQHRETIAVDMEAASFYMALSAFKDIKPLCVKGVSDHADQLKDDTVHSYAKELAAGFALELIKQYFAQPNRTLRNDLQRSKIEKLLVAAQNNQWFVINRLLSEGIDINSSGDILSFNGIQQLLIRSSTALHEACAYGHLSLVQQLIGHGANVNQRTKENWTPLHAATINGKKEVALLLVAKGAEIEAEDNWQKTAVDGAKMRRHLELYNELVELNAEISQSKKYENYHDDLGLMQAVTDRNTNAIKHLVRRCGWDVNAKYFWRKQYADFPTPLSLAVFKNDVQLVTLLLQLGATVDHYSEKFCRSACDEIKQLLSDQVTALRQAQSNSAEGKKSAQGASATVSSSVSSSLNLPYYRTRSSGASLLAQLHSDNSAFTFEDEEIGVKHKKRKNKKQKEEDEPGEGAEEEA